MTTHTGPRADYSKASGGGKALIDAMGQMSQAEAARELGVSAGFIHRLIRGEKRPGLDLAKKIRDRFGVPVDAW